MSHPRYDQLANRPWEPELNYFDSNSRNNMNTGPNTNHHHVGNRLNNNNNPNLLNNNNNGQHNKNIIENENNKMVTNNINDSNNLNATDSDLSSSLTVLKKLKESNELLTKVWGLQQDLHNNALHQMKNKELAEKNDDQSSENNNNNNQLQQAEILNGNPLLKSYKNVLDICIDQQRQIDQNNNENNNNKINNDQDNNNNNNSRNNNNNINNNNFGDLYLNDMNDEMTNLENDILIRQNFNEIYKSYMENRPSSVITVVDKRKMEQMDQSQNDNNNTNFNDFANEKWPTSPENLIENPPNNQHQPINPTIQSNQKTALTNLPKQKNDSGVSSSPFSRNGQNGVTDFNENQDFQQFSAENMRYLPLQVLIEHFSPSDWQMWQLQRKNEELQERLCETHRVFLGGFYFLA